VSLFKEKNLSRWVVILPIISVIVTAMVFVTADINNRKNSLKTEIQQEQIKLLRYHKQEAMKKVNNMASFLKTTKVLQKEQAREDVKNMVDIALNVIKNIYALNQNLTKKEILEKVKVSLRYARFWKGTGYFFIYDLDGNCVLMPPAQSMENTNLFGLKDAKGKYTIKEHIDIVKKKSEGFSEWYWYKPNEKVMKKKIGFVKAFKPLDIYIGTARYEEDIISSIKSKIILMLNNNEEDFFIYDKHGKSVLNSDKYINRNKIFMIIKGAKIVPEGFFINHTSLSYYNISEELKTGTFFIKYVPEFDWIIGLDTYDEESANGIKIKKEFLEKKNISLMQNRIFFAIVLVIMMLIITTFFSNKLKSVLKRYQKSLIKEKEKLTYSLKHDYLTSLPNRLLLTDRLEQDIKHFPRTKNKVAVIFCDVDKFKSINDSLGHSVGDIALKEIAKRLKKSIRSTDTVSRFSGDEFIVLVNDFESTFDIIKIISKIQKSFEYDIELENTLHNITLSIGISIFPSDGKNVGTLLKNADIAMYKAKKEGGNRYRFFTSKMNEETQNQIILENELKVAVKKGEFVLHYQPLVESKSGKIVGVEALVRWNHPTRGLVFPDEFISIAEQSSVIVDMGRWIIHEAMGQMSKWKSKGYKLEKMSINIAIRQLESSAFIECMKNTLIDTSCRGDWIEIEIIERFAMKNITKSIEVLHEVRKLNIDIAIDDFGTGHSSLAYLKKLPITKLKIDRTFVSNILNSYEDKAIAESIMALGSGLNLKVLAEGIETKEQKDFFIKHNCKEMQGCFFSKSLPVQEVEKILKKGSCG